MRNLIEASAHGWSYSVLPTSPLSGQPPPALYCATSDSMPATQGQRSLHRKVVVVIDGVMVANLLLA